MLGEAGWQSGGYQQGVGTGSGWSYLVRSGMSGWGVLLLNVAAVPGEHGWCRVQAVD
jgi:hypothetical protein